MTTTTSYGTWNNHGDRTNTSMGASILDAINGGDREWQERMEASGALDRIERDYDAAINEALPDGVSLCGSEFHGPYYEADYTWEGKLNIAEIIEDISLQTFIERHDVDTNAVVKITHTSTLPESREGRGVVRVKTLTYDGDAGQSPHEWAAEMLNDAGCTRHNSGAQYVTKEPKVTDYARGEETTSVGEVTGLNDDQVAELFRLMG
ncbi:hypothetical protein ACFQ6C_26710 [Streptomyces sp. NPDC056454]|uniref:hypothetical protein n=1 Tax=Streptomyces sp. NPDC056454 TaxID=3345823 RepID=UPI0036842427